jgi:hypothetical protein
MSTQPLNEKDALEQRLNTETAKINWHELQKHYAAGNVLAVAETADLIKVAVAFHQDDTTKVQAWLADKTLFEINDEQALDWYKSKTEHWAVVIPPFVLAQKVK